VSYLAPLLPYGVDLALLGAAFGLLEFAGTVLVTAAAVEAEVTPAPGAGLPAPLRSPAR
jgi:hypothetical protein